MLRSCRGSIANRSTRGGAEFAGRWRSIPAGHRATVTNGDTAAVTLPLRKDARDPLSALFYVRTSAAGAGFRAPVLVNDAGRNTTVDVKVVAAESVTVDNRLRTPGSSSRRSSPGSRGAPPRATVWLSRDSRKVPLRIRVSDAFGTVDIELVEYPRLVREEPRILRAWAFVPGPSLVLGCPSSPKGPW